MIDTAIFTRLSTDSQITTLAGTRIRAGVLAQGDAVPAISFFRVSTTPVQNLNNLQSNLERSRYQFNIWAKSPKAARELAVKVRARLDGLNTTLSGMRIFGIMLVNELDFYEDETGLFRVAQDYFITYRVAT